MKKLITSLTITIGLLASANTAMAGGMPGAQPMNVPPSTIGVTEATFQDLKDATCVLYDNRHLDEPYESWTECDRDVQHLFGETIMRVEDKGQLYSVYFAPHEAGIDAPVAVERTLPNGFYKAGNSNKYFWVSNGYRTKVTKHNAKRKLKKAVTRQDLRLVSIQSFNAHLLFGTSCELHNTEDAEEITIWENCNEEYAAATKYRKENGFNMIGYEYYPGLYDIYLTTPHVDENVTGFHNKSNADIFSTIQFNSTTVKPRLLRKLKSYKNL